MGQLHKKCLLIAFHYPPCRTSSGYLRTEKFVRYLPEFGWSPEVLTAKNSAYGDGSEAGNDSSGAIVHRTLAFDAQRALSINGKYFECLTLPDRWWSWFLTAVWRGLKLLRRSEYHIIWSTYPTPTALLVGFALKRLSGCPWVVDLRDPMIDEVHPCGRLKRAIYRRIEALAVKSSDALVVTTPGAQELYLKRYPEIDGQTIHCIGNGFDEADFQALERTRERVQSHDKIQLVHSGTLYPLERNPLPFLNALAQLKQNGLLSDLSFEVVLRASGHDDWLRQEIVSRGLSGWVQLAPAIDYQLALREMLEADGLLLFQADNCQAQIPAKLYEYLRSGNPIFALVDAAGDTANLLRQAGSSFQVDLMDEQAIAKQLVRFIETLVAGKTEVPDKGWVSELSRRQRARQLSNLFDDFLEL